ncbi:MAG: hypothetical protein ACRDRT_16030, partial [Pseudonocardiaceae bacterium]
MDAPIAPVLTGQLPLLLIIAALLSLPVGLGLLWWYRRAVIASMMLRGEKGGRDAAPTARPAVPAQSPTGIEVRLAAVGEEAGAALPRSSASELWRRARRGLSVSAAIYAVAGSTFAAVMTAAFLTAGHMEFLPVRTLTVFWGYFWAVVVAIYLVVPGRRLVLYVVGGYFLVYAALGALGLAASPDLTVAQFFIYWLVANGPPTVLLLLFLQRRIRAVGPLVLVLMLISLIGANLAIALAGSSDAGLRAMIELAALFGLGAHGTFW